MCHITYTWLWDKTETPHITSRCTICLSLLSWFYLMARMRGLRVGWPSLLPCHLVAIKDIPSNVWMGNMEHRLQDPKPKCRTFFAVSHTSLCTCDWCLWISTGSILLLFHWLLFCIYHESVESLWEVQLPLTSVTGQLCQQTTRLLCLQQTGWRDDHTSPV